MKKYFVFIIVFFFYAFDSYSQYALDTLWKITDVDLKKYNEFNFRPLITGITQNPLDSTLLVSYWNDDDNKPIYKLATIDSKTGKILQNRNTTEQIYELEFLKNSNQFIAKNGYFSIIDNLTLESLFIDTIFSVNGTYNKSIDRALVCNNALVRIYDTKKKAKITEYNKFNFFGDPEMFVYKAFQSSINNYLIINTSQNKPLKYYMSVIDTNKKIVFEDNPSSSSKGALALSNNNRYVAYMGSDNNIKVLDLTSLKIISSTYNEYAFNKFTFSYDDSLLFAISDYDLHIINIKTQTSTRMLNSVDVATIIQDKFNPKLIYTCNPYGIRTFKFSDKSDVVQNPIQENQFTVQYKTETQSLNLNMNLISNGNLQIILYNLNSIPLKQLENNMYNISNYIKNYDMSNLPNGAYYLQIKINNQVVSQNLSFIKAN